MMGLILGRKYGGKGETEKGQGGKAKMTASSHWISIQLVGGRKRGKIWEGTKKVRISFLLRNFFSFSVSLPVFSCLTPYTGHSFFPFSIVSDLCHAAIQHTHEQLISQAELLRATCTVYVLVQNSAVRQLQSRNKNTGGVKERRQHRTQRVYKAATVGETVSALRTLQGIHALTGSSALTI